MCRNSAVVQRFLWPLAQIARPILRRLLGEQRRQEPLFRQTTHGDASDRFLYHFLKRREISFAIEDLHLAETRFSTWYTYPPTFTRRYLPMPRSYAIELQASIKGV